MSEDPPHIVAKTAIVTPSTEIPADLRVMARPEDVYEWDKQIELCGVLSGFNDYQKERARRAFRFLRDEFGEAFLKEAYAERHPILEYFANLAPWTREWIVWFAESLKAVRKAGDYSGLRHRIRERDTFPEALTVLDVAQRLTKVGFAVAFDPTVDFGVGQGSLISR